MGVRHKSLSITRYMRERSTSIIEGIVLLVTSGITAFSIITVAHGILGWEQTPEQFNSHHPDGSVPNIAFAPLTSSLAPGTDRTVTNLPLVGDRVTLPLAHLMAPLAYALPDRSAAADPTSLIAIDYFLAIALGSEFGSSQLTVKKWVDPVRIQVHGTPTTADRAALRAVLDDLRAIAPALDIRLTHQGGNLDLYFVPPSQFGRYEPNYQPGNLGFFWADWEQDTISRARVLISSETVSQDERSHLIREELTQALGLMNDSDRYPDSIFYGPWTQTTQYSDLDAAIIGLLYHPTVQPGMTATDVFRALHTSTAAVQPVSSGWHQVQRR